MAHERAPIGHDHEGARDMKKAAIAKMAAFL
jgi:hypothetical protein